ncbi:hypothetical protein G9A89_001353 [Geosiphon pyriformis]|nr:hypothetical protein G9A89_001353 [Geosiphon pyriformis]
MVLNLFYQEKKKSGVLAKSVLTGDTTESESVDIKKECLIEETSIDYNERDIFDGGDSNQTLKSLGIKIKTKKVLDKPLGKINFEDGFDNSNFLDKSVLFLPFLLLKPSVHVSVHKSFILDINLVAIAGKFSQKKLNFIKKIFSDVNGFGGASIPSKFGGIIYVTFTSEMVMMATGKLAYDYNVVVNTDLKYLVNNRTNWDIVIKVISVGISIEAVHIAVSKFGVVVSIKMQLVGLWQKAIVTLEDSNQTDLLASKWSIFIRKDAVRVARANMDKQTWDSRDEFKALLYTFFVGTNAHDLWDFIGSVSGKTCVIEHNSVNYTQAHCTTMCFEFESDLNWALANTLVINDVRLHWSHLFAVLCSSCNSLGHTSRNCKSAGVSSSPKSKRASFSVQNWFRLAKIYEKKSAPVSHLLAFGGKTWALVVGSIPLGTSLKYDSQLSSIRNGKPLLLVVNDLEKCLVSIESSLVSLAEQIGELAKRLESFVLAVSQSSPECQLPEDIVIGVNLGNATNDKTATISGSTVLPEVVKLENMLEGLSALVMSLSVCLDGLALAGDMNNLVSIFMELKLKGKVFTSGLDSGFLDAGVLIVMNSSLAKHICKVSEVPGWLLFIKLLFKNKLSVSILGLYAGALSVVWFFQAGEINSLIAKAVNESFFCASFKKCLELGLVNSLIGSLVIKMPTWANSRGVMKTIDYVFVSPNLVNSLVHCGVLDISKYFNTDHQAVSVSVAWVVNKDCWKFNVKNVSEAKWLEFKDAMAANTTMFSGVFGVAIMVFSAGSAFKKKWFKGFDTVYNKMSSRFHKLELLVSKLVKAFCLSSSNNLDSASASTVRSMFFSGAKFDNIHSALAKARKLYCSSKLLESKCAEKSHIRQAITNKIESFELDKSHTIRSVLECPFRKVVLNHLVVDNELILKPDLVKSKVDAIIEGWTKKCVVVDDISDTWSHQY